MKTFLALILLALPALAEIDRTQPPAPAPAPTSAFPDYKTVVLTNGLKVFINRHSRFVIFIL